MPTEEPSDTVSKCFSAVLIENVSDFPRQKLQQLETLYQQTLHGTELIVKDEDSRRLRLQILLMEEDMAEINEQLSSDDERINDLEQERDELKIQLEQGEEEARRMDGSLRTTVREVSGLKVRVFNAPGISEGILI